MCVCVPFLFFLALQLEFGLGWAGLPYFINPNASKAH
jgi:hypothetical protein